MMSRKVKAELKEAVRLAVGVMLMVGAIWVEQ